MKLSDLLFSQGFGTRRECLGLIQHGRVRLGGTAIDDPDHELAPEGLDYEVEGVPWRYQARALLMLPKPAGYECSAKPSSWPPVLSLLPLPLRRRGVQAVGRLDQDTTGLLLLTDDGPLLHRLTSPKHAVPKVYEATVKHPLTDDQLRKLCTGVTLNDSPVAVSAAQAEAISPLHLRLTLMQGKYHQVKRMVAAVSNRVEALHRSAIGEMALPADLAPGQWRWIEDTAPLFPRP